MLRKLMMSIVTIMLIAIVSACGNDNEEPKEEDAVTETEPEQEEEEELDEPEQEEEEELDEPEEEVESEKGSADFSELISYMEETVDGTANVLFETDEEQVHESDDAFTISLNGYTLVELNDFHADFEIPFEDNTDGGVLIAEYTIENIADEDAYLMPDFYISYPETQKFHSNNKALLPEEDQLPTKLAPSTDYLIEAGETITGYIAYSFAPDILDKIIDLSTVDANVPEPHSEKGDVNSNFGKEGKLTLALSDEGSEKAETNKTFYEDRVTYDNMGDKEMLKEKDEIGESEDLRDVKVTLDGYQFTEFTPNDEEAPRFENFSNGITLLTVKFDLENEAEDEIGLNSVSSKLTVNDGAQYMLNEGMLLLYGNDEVIEPGESGELLQVYVLDQEQYEKIWKDKSFEVEIGPMKDAEAKDISKGSKVEFTLPE